jgi:hypothetical protein
MLARGDQDSHPVYNGAIMYLHDIVMSYYDYVTLV